MSQSDTNQLLGKVETLWKNSAELLQSSLLIRGIGYGLLLLVLIDLINLFIPPNFLNPAWEFQTFGAIIDRIVVPLIALVLIFWGGRSGRFKFEFPILNGLAWLSLVAGILLLITVPLGVFNTIRLNRQADTQINNQIEQSKTQIKQLQKRVGDITSEVQMKELLSQFSQTGSAPNINESQLEKTKKDLLSSLAQSESSLATQAQAAQKNQRIVLLKSSVKWNLGALIASALFFWIWLFTDWARKK